MLTKLQRKTLIPSQIAGYGLTMLVGVAIALLTLQLYVDIKPLLTQQTDVFKAHTVTVSKNITLFKTANKDGIYFDDSELQQLKEQDFVAEVAQFTSASFNTSASINLGDGMPSMSTELFFESVPDAYLDVQSDSWVWDSSSNFLPVIIPEDYLNLYNFGFAESQSLPVVSQGTIEQVTFSIHVSGNGKQRTYNSRIVGFSNKINSILVPETFLKWANREYGTAGRATAVNGARQNGQEPSARSSRLLIEFSDASDERIPQYFEEHGYNINEAELESGKLIFFFRFALILLLAVAAIIILLSMAFIVMSVNLILQRNRSLFIGLYNIGYTPVQIARFYRRVVSAITVCDVLLAAVAVVVIRQLYLSRLARLFELDTSVVLMWIAAAVVLVFLVVVYNVLIVKNIERTIKG